MVTLLSSIRLRSLGASNVPCFVVKPSAWISLARVGWHHKAVKDCLVKNPMFAGIAHFWGSSTPILQIFMVLASTLVIIASIQALVVQKDSHARHFGPAQR
jgi:hypothetical protein